MRLVDSQFGEGLGAALFDTRQNMQQQQGQAAGQGDVEGCEPALLLMPCCNLVKNDAFQLGRGDIDLAIMHAQGERGSR
ncbi:hypothetical protein D3C84_663380 [compost metagenome]